MLFKYDSIESAFDSRKSDEISGVCLVESVDDEFRRSGGEGISFIDGAIKPVGLTHIERATRIAWVWRRDFSLSHVRNVEFRDEQGICAPRLKMKMVTPASALVPRNTNLLPLHDWSVQLQERRWDITHMTIYVFAVNFQESNCLIEIRNNTSRCRQNIFTL